MEISLRSPIVLQCIFKNLSAKELNTCAQVCSIWNQIAKAGKKRRIRSLSWFLCKDCDEHEGDCETAFANVVNNLYCEPEFVLVFATIKKLTWRKVTKKDTKRMKITADGRNLAKAVPFSRDVIICTAPGIIGTMSDFSATEELEEGSNGLASVYFPNFSGVKIHKCKISDLRRGNREQLNIPPHDSLKCLLIFMDNVRCTADEVALMRYVNESYVTFGVGGGRLNKVSTRSSGRDNSKLCQGNFFLAFTGNNIRSVSVVIPSEVDTPYEVEKVLEKFWETDIFNGQCIAISFACNARGEHMFSKRNVECDAFRKLFPHIPLLGVFANGEIGVTYLPGVPEGPPLTMVPEERAIFHFYSTIFVVISVVS